MPNMLLHVGNGLPGIGFVPTSVKLFRDCPELHHKIARKVLWFDLATFLAPQPEQRRLVSL
jgi:hypothetical protein